MLFRSRTALAIAQSLSVLELQELYKDDKDTLRHLESAIRNYDSYIEAIYDLYNQCLEEEGGEENGNSIRAFEESIKEIQETHPEVYLAYELQMASFHHLVTTCHARNILSTGVAGLKLNSGAGINPHLFRLVPPYVVLQDRDGKKSVLPLQKKLLGMTMF